MTPSVFNRMIRVCFQVENRPTTQLQDDNDVISGNDADRIDVRTALNSEFALLANSIAQLNVTSESSGEDESPLESADERASMIEEIGEGGLRSELTPPPLRKIEADPSPPPLNSTPSPPPIMQAEVEPPADKSSVTSELSTDDVIDTHPRVGGGDEDTTSADEVG